MRLALLQSGRVLALVALGLGLGRIAQAQPEAVPYADDAERQAGWALLLEPLAFEGDELSQISAEILADQALTLAANPDLDVVIGVAGADAAETEERIEALERAYAELGVADGQLQFLPAAGADVRRPGGDGGDLAARVLTTRGALGAGVLQRAYVVVSWPGADLYRIPESVYEETPSAQARRALLCAPPDAAHIASVPPSGRIERRTSRPLGWLVARDARNGTATTPHDAEDAAPVDLTVADPSCE